MNWQAMVGLGARHALGVAGGYALSKGWITEGDVEPLMGAALAIGAVVWSVVQKKQSGVLEK